MLFPLPRYRFPHLTSIIALVGAASCCIDLAIGQDESSSDATPVLRVLSYNIHHAEGTDGKLDLERIASVVRDSKADLVALQEVDRRVGRSNGVDQPQVLAKSLNMQALFRKNLEFGGGEYGNAILSRFALSAPQNKWLTQVGSGEQRGLLSATISLPFAPHKIRFYSTHLDHRASAKEQLLSVSELSEFAAATSMPQILAGDLNMVADSQAFRSLQTQWRSVNAAPIPTIPVQNPTRQIDFILIGPQDAWEVLETRRMDESIASDHRALLTVLRWSPNTELKSEH